jgi:hypothetical protein
MKLRFLCIVVFALMQNAVSYSQNISINVLTQNAGSVAVGGTVLLEVQVCNTGTIATPINKVRPQISVPPIVTIAGSGHTLPSGWTIVSNSGSVIRICNGSDNFAAGTCRTALIALQGTSAGGPSTISGQLTFANGTNCSVTGAATAGDLSADNTSTSSISVAIVTPVKLSAFNVKLLNCRPLVTWKTEEEINSERFEIQRANVDNLAWRTIATVAARGNSGSTTDYSFTDNDLANSNDKVVYRLKMIDQDGSFKYSGTVQLNANCKTLNMDLYPNPAHGSEVIVNINGGKGKIEGLLISPTGQLVKRVQLINGMNNIDIKMLPAGTYLLDVKDGNGTSQKLKFNIQR